MLTWSEQFLHRFTPIFYRLIIHFYYDMLDQRRTDTFVSKRKMNGRIAAVEFKDGPHRRAHLLALPVGGVSRNTQSQESYKGRNDCVVSTGAARLLLLQHDADHMTGGLRVNKAGGGGGGGGWGGG